MKNDTPTLIARFHERSYAKVERYFVHRNFSEDDAKDLAQETFVRALARADTLKDPKKLRAWIFTIAGNVLANETRWRERQPQVLTFSDVEAIRRRNNFDDGGDPYEGGGHMGHPENILLLIEEEVAAYRQQDEMVLAVGTLPHRMRACVILRYRHNLKIREIAGLLKISAGAVKTQLHRALQRLRDASMALMGSDESSAPPDPVRRTSFNPPAKASTNQKGGDADVDT